MALWNNLLAQKKVFTDKVRKAADFKAKAREPFFTATPLADPNEEECRVVFCEDCGQREVISYKKAVPLSSIVCSQCGDRIETGAAVSSSYRRNTFISVIGGGEGSFLNLLEIIPRLDPEMGGALIVVIQQETEHLNYFTEYLDAISAMKVIRAREGINIEGGNCYIASGHDNMHLKHHNDNAQLTLQRLQKEALSCGPIDILLASVSTLFKKRACGIILSGDENDGDKGLSILVKNGGTPIILDGPECYCKNLGRHILNQLAMVKTYQTQEIVDKIKTLHSKAKEGTLVDWVNPLEENRF
jgi:two-component system, chemotaxis family, protein-glutamate methylesterase/glutaminase